MTTDTSARVAIVTGASRGIGLATARALDRAEYVVVLVARSQNDLRETASGIPSSLVIAGDVTSSATCNSIVEQTVARFGRIDALVNNAGVAPLLPVEETTDEIWRSAIDTNLSSTFYLSRACFPVFKRQGVGVIVNVSSAAARDPFPGFIAYGAAKAAVNNLGISLAKEGAKDNIRVHTIAPSAVETQMFRGLPGMAEYPAEEMLSPDDVAKLIVGCVTGALAHTSGEVIYLHR